jgi:hypothetical protein
MKSAVDRLVELLLPSVARSLDGVCRHRIGAEELRKVVERCVAEVAELGSTELKRLERLLRRGEEEPLLVSAMDAVGVCILAELHRTGKC